MHILYLTTLLLGEMLERPFIISLHFNGICSEKVVYQELIKKLIVLICTSMACSNKVGHDTTTRMFQLEVWDGD